MTPTKGANTNSPGLVGKEKKYKHRKTDTSKGNISLRLFSLLIACLERRPLFLLANLSRLMEEKMEEPISHVQGWVDGWITIKVARYYCRMIHRAHLPITLWDREMDWESVSGLGLVQ